MPTVKAHGKVIQFPDGMSREEILQALSPEKEGPQEVQVSLDASQIQEIVERLLEASGPQEVDINVSKLEEAISRLAPQPIDVTALEAALGSLTLDTGGLENALSNIQITLDAKDIDKALSKREISFEISTQKLYDAILELTKQLERRRKVRATINRKKFSGIDIPLAESVDIDFGE